MESELMPQCGACGSRGTHKVGAETAAPAVGCHCGVIVTGFTEAEATERWERLARRAEIGRLVEEILHKTWYVQLAAEPDGHTRMYDVRTECRSSYTDTLLDALRSLAAEIGGDDEAEGAR